MDNEELELIVLEGVEPPPLSDIERQKYELLNRMRQMELDDITPRFQREMNIANAQDYADRNGTTLEALAEVNVGLAMLIIRNNEFVALRKQYLELVEPEF